MMNRAFRRGGEETAELLLSSSAARVAVLQGQWWMRRIPLWLKLAYTAFVAAIVPVYVRQYGWRNFLWFSDVALFLTLPALWLAHPLPASMQAVSITVPETGWAIDLIARQLFGTRLIGL